MSLIRSFLHSYICKILCIAFLFSLDMYANPINLYSANNVFSTKAIKAIELLLNSDGENNFTTGDDDIAYITGPVKLRDTTGDVYLVFHNTEGFDITGDINFTGTLYENGVEFVSGGGITAVGDVTSGAAFDGTQGTTLTFYDAGGNATLTYNGTTLTPSVYITSTLIGDITGDASGNATTATALETARTIAGVSFDGTGNINIASTGLSDTAALLYETELDDFSEIQTQISNKTLVNEEDDVTWDGTHIFSTNFPVTPSSAPTANYEVANKKYVDDNAGAGDITSIGDVTSGAAFDGTQGTTLTFYDAGGNATFTYDGTTVTSNKRHTFTSGFSTSVDSTCDANFEAATLTEGGTGIYNSTESDAAYEAELDNSAGLLSALSDETGTGLVIFSIDPIFTAGIDVSDDIDASSDLTVVGTIEGGVITEGGAGVYNTTESDSAYEAELDNSAGLLTALSDETGTGLAVFNTSPTFTGDVTTDANFEAATLTEGGTGIYNSTESDAVYEAELDNSAGLLSALSDETGTGLAVFNTSPTFSGDSTSDANFEAATLTEGGVGVPNTDDILSVFAATTSAQLAGIISNETGTGKFVLDTDPVFAGFPVTPSSAPDADYEVANKKYVDDNAGAGDITAVGDVTSGAAFDGTQGTTLTFYNAGGNGTFTYNGTTVTSNKRHTFTGGATAATELLLNNDVPLTLGTAVNQTASMKLCAAYQTKDSVLLGLPEESKALVITTHTQINNNFQHGAFANPVIYLHSRSDPDSFPTEYLMFYANNGGNSYIYGGDGTLNIYCEGGAVNFNTGLTSTDINFTGNLTEDSGAYSCDGKTTYREITFLPEDAILDDNIPPVISTKESSGTGTPQFKVAQFDDGTDDTLYWNFVVPSDMTASSAWYADVYSYSDEDVDEDVLWSIQISATSDDDVDNVEEQAADTASVAVENYDKTEAKALCVCTITMGSADIDSVAASDLVTIIFKRDGDDASDDHTNNGVYLARILLRIPRSN